MFLLLWETRSANLARNPSLRATLGYTGHMGYMTYTCPIGRECGGCEWLAVPYPIQLRRKNEQVSGLFAEMAAADGTIVDDVRGMDEPVAFRFKAATPFAPGKGGRGLAPDRPLRELPRRGSPRATHPLVCCPHSL